MKRDSSLHPNVDGPLLPSVGNLSEHPFAEAIETFLRKGGMPSSVLPISHDTLHGFMVVELEDKLRTSIVPTWKTVISAYLEECENRGLTKKTVYNTRVCLEAHTLGAWGERFIDSISTQDVRTLMQQKVGERMPAHQRYFLKCIRSAFNYAVELNHIARNPTPQMKFRVGDKIQKVLTEDQARTLLAKAREQGWKWFYHYAVALYTGMRNGEL